jgi:hypothetical protein
MVAPTGVNEELPQEPAKAGRAGAELAEPQAAEAETAEAAPAQAVEETDEKATPTGVVLAAVVPPQAAPAAEERAAADVGVKEAEPAEAEPRGTVPAEPIAAEADPAEAEPAGAGPATEGPATEGLTVEGPVEAGAAEADRNAEEGGRDVSPLAVIGIIFGFIALVGVAVGVLAVVTHGFRHKTVITYRPAAVFGLRPGQCVDSGSNALKFTVLSCARPHDAEVFAAFTLPAGPWPGTSAVRADAGNGCASRFDSYIDPQLATASLTQEYVYPNRGAWQAGERTVVCEVSAVDGRLTGSVRAPG